ncbi:hypothetical protein CRYUN_Cryun30bG0036700 [Craigia yunnanensis]
MTANKILPRHQNSPRGKRTHEEDSNTHSLAEKLEGHAFFFSPTKNQPSQILFSHYPFLYNRIRKLPQKKKNPKKNSFLFPIRQKKNPKMFHNQDSVFPLMETVGGNSSRTRSLYHLPPGCRFYPSEEELLNHYLTGKNSSVTVDRVDMYGNDLIRELNLYDYEPSDLPEGACFVHGYRGRKRHWFCYTESKGGKGRRRTKGGFWRKIGKVRDVIDGGNVLLGTRTKFVFYEVNSVKAAVRTPWIMYEYALLHHLKASFVLCRVFVKSRAGNSASENVLNSCAEESVSAVLLSGTQHNGFLTPDILEAKINVDDFTKELDDPIATRPVSVASFEFPSGIPPDLPNDQVRSRLTTSELLSIVEEDFIELDDLQDDCP